MIADVSHPSPTTTQAVTLRSPIQVQVPTKERGVIQMKVTDRLYADYAIYIESVRVCRLHTPNGVIDVPINNLLGVASFTQAK